MENISIDIRAKLISVFFNLLILEGRGRFLIIFQILA